MNPDRDMASAFIAALTGSSGTAVTWQLIMDDKRARRYAHVYPSLPLTDSLWRELCYQNGRGVGIFAMVNSGDGEDRRAENVVALRALFVDDDAGKLVPESDRFAQLRPSFSVRSKRGFHHYWLLRPGEPLDAFGPAQMALAAHFDTDAAVKDLPRVMRVPGFFHRKDPASPFMVELVPGTGGRHSVSEVLVAYPAPVATGGAVARLHSDAPVVRKPSRRAPSDSGAAGVVAAFRGLRLIRWAMQHPEDVSREAWRGIATNIAAAVLEHEDMHDLGAELFHEVSACDPARYTPADCDRAFKDALKSARHPGPMTFAALEAAGVPADICAGRQFAKAPIGVARQLARRGEHVRVL